MLVRSPVAETERRAPVPSGSPVSLIVVDGRRHARERMVEVLRTEPGFLLLASSAVASAVPTLLPPDAATLPLVVLLDVSMSEADSLAGCRRLHALAPRTSIVMTGMSAPHDAVAAFVHAGATGFIMSTATSTQIIETVRHVAYGESSLPRALTTSLFSQIRTHIDYGAADAPGDRARLTKRERQIIALLGEGLSNKDIAARLYIAVHTVKSHVHNILEKLSLHSRLEVAAYSRSPRFRT